MNSIPFIDFAWMRPQFPEMMDAVTDGYIHSFVKTPDGLYRCLSNPERYYYGAELCIEEIKCPGVILYRIAPKDFSYCGTYHRYTTTSTY